MGIYFNPGNESFSKDKRSEIYIDKTGLLAYLNKIISTSNNCIAVSHARRFGKSHAAGMIDAYYSCGCDSTDLFTDTDISKDSSYRIHLNKYHVIHIDVSSMLDFHKEDLIDFFIKSIVDEIKESYPNLNIKKDISAILMQLYENTKCPIVIILDEWDCVIRNCAHDKDLVHRYMQLLHGILKSEEAKRYLALAYITGILPIKKLQDESALNNFREFTMLKSKPITKYFGFTEEEVKELCTKYDMDFEIVKAWYDGYLLDGIHMYNPNSVVLSMINQDYDTYWRNTSSFTSINTYISMNYAGLKDDIISMLSGQRVYLNTQTFQNDLSILGSKDDVLTALIHLGYLGYDGERKCSYMPNYEVATAFDSALQTGEWNDIARSISRCDELLEQTIFGNADRVAELVELAHESYTSILTYNDENSLSCVLTMAYFTAQAYYHIIREMPAGKEYADFVFIPRSNASYRPAMIVELKYNKDADTAIRQIKDKRYQGALSGYSGKILLVGINYETSGNIKKHHSCLIEEWEERI